MNRRTFTTAGIAAIAGGEQKNKPEGGKVSHYLLDIYSMKSGAQVTRFHDFLREHGMPALQRLHRGPVIAMEALVASHMPATALLTGYSSLDEIGNLRRRLLSDPALAKAYEQWESEQAYERLDRTLLETAPYSPAIPASVTKPSRPRIFEWRVYHSPTARQLMALHQRFREHEIGIFHRVGVRPILITSTLAGRNMPNLTYLIPFDSLAEREKAWTAFAADEEWIKVRKESTARHGDIVSVIEMSLYRAAPYSPFQ